jgi:transposase
MDSAGRRRTLRSIGRASESSGFEAACEADPKKSIRECAAELGINDKTLNDWVIKFGRTGKVTQARTGEQKEPDEVRRRIGELESESEFLKKAAAFFARSL